MNQNNCKFSCRCKNIKGKLIKTVIKSSRKKRIAVDNINGLLKIAKVAACTKPTGSYLKSCSGCTLNKNTCLFTCNCKNMKGKNIKTSYYAKRGSKRVLNNING